MDTKILKAILDYDFYMENCHRLKAKLFDSEVRDLFEIIRDAHEAYPGKILSVDDLQALWTDTNPTSTRAEQRSMNGLIEDIGSVDTLQPEITQRIIANLWKRDIGKQIANLGIEINEGSDEAVAKLRSLLEQTQDGFMPDDFGESTTKDLDQLLEMISDDNRWKFNISTLAKHVYGIGPGEFGIVFAAPETGKSAFVVSLVAGPDGFCEQGAKVLYLGNEEATKRTMLRAIQSWTGMTRDEIRAHPSVAATKFLAIRDRLEMKDIQDFDLDRVEAYIEKQKPNVVIIDQADKVNISGTFAATHEKLRELYRRLRELAKRYDCALIVVSQASAEVAGKTRLTPFQMEGSKIGKFSEADLIIGIGKAESASAEEEDYTRYLNIGKNKLSGFHGMVVCNIQPHISRYVE